MAGIKLSGMVSGLDTESIVQGLTSGYKVKIDSKTKDKKNLELQQEAWEDMNKKLVSFYKGSLSKFKTYGNYNTKKTSVVGTNAGSATVTAGAGAATGTYSMKINSVASSAFLTGAKLNGSKDNGFDATYNASNATTFSQMISGDGTALGDSLVGKTISFSATYRKSDTESETKTFTYTFDNASSVTDINAKLKEAGITGITAGMNNGKLTFENTAGYKKEADGSLQYANASFAVMSADGALKTLGFDSDLLDVNVTMKATTRNGETTYEAQTAQTSNTAYSYKSARTTAEAGTKMSDYLSGLFDGAQSETVENKDGGTTTRRYISMKLTVGGEDKQVKIYEDDTFSSFAQNIKKASGGKVTGGFDAENQRFFFNSASTGTENDFTISADNADSSSQQALEKLGLVASSMYSGTDVMSSQRGADASVVVNGATITSSSNTIRLSALGLTVNLESASAVNQDSDPDNDQTLTINVTNDPDAAYKMVKDFLKEYNELMTDMYEKYNAEDNDYKPLTEDEEKEMSDSQVDKWNKKVEEKLLRRDSTLSDLMDTMRTSLTGSYKITNDDGTTSNRSLSSFGIVTGAYTENGILHIEGDEDDGTYSGYTNRLKEALSNDPESVMKTLAQAGQKLYDSMTAMSRSTTLRSTQTFYNDKYMKSQLSDYDSEIDDLQDQMDAMQDKYYSQFTRMETALSKLNSTAASMGFSSGSSS